MFHVDFVVCEGSFFADIPYIPGFHERMEVVHMKSTTANLKGGDGADIRIFKGVPAGF